MNSKTSRAKSQSSASKKRSQSLTALALLSAISSQSMAAGFSLLQIDDPGSAKPLELGVWYPSEATPPPEPNTPFNQALATEVKPSGEQLSLVMVSHGFGGWLGGHADTAKALADAGFVVAAPSHTGNTFRDMSSSVDQWIVDRPHQISTAIDYLQQKWEYRSLLSEGPVGVFGFSAGGLTALSLLGAVPSLAKAEQHCLDTPEEFGCEDAELVPALLASESFPAEHQNWGKDSRIAAAAIAAPGFAFSYEADTLAAIDTPVQLWSALNDKRVPHESNALPLAQSLPQVETQWVKDAGHFAFMVQPCTEKLKKYEPETWDFLCVDPEGFDRWQFHHQMNAEITRFFSEKLARK
ncbi:MAG: alpha/beta hydrolase family protein [Granulosicoccaceae bacterium]